MGCFFFFFFFLRNAMVRLCPLREGGLARVGGTYGSTLDVHDVSRLARKKKERKKKEKSNAKKGITTPLQGTYPSCQAWRSTGSYHSMGRGAGREGGRM